MALPFLFMGCWNRTGPARDCVARALRRNPITHLVLGGDNVYPTKSVDVTTGAKTKAYDMRVLEEGLAALHTKTILGTALGNHNISDPAIRKEQMKRLLPGSRDGATYYRLTHDDVDLVFLDSNLMETDPTDMLAWLVDTLRTRGATPYFLIQHEPVLAFKKHKRHQLKNAKALLDVLIHRPPIAILCADTHHYQHGIIEYKGVHIAQYIVGTGGAEPDFMKADTDILNVDDITYRRIEYMKGYGYLQVNTPSHIEFIHVCDWAEHEGVGGGGGGRRQRKTRKRRAGRSRKLVRVVNK